MMRELILSGFNVKELTRPDFTFSKWSNFKPVETHLNLVTELGAPEGRNEEDVSAKLNIVLITIFARSHT